ncbi:unnamed protein product [Parajaminaea phylloscopi]
MPSTAVPSDAAGDNASHRRTTSASTSAAAATSHTSGSSSNPSARHAAHGQAFHGATPSFELSVNPLTGSAAPWTCDTPATSMAHHSGIPHISFSGSSPAVSPTASPNLASAAPAQGAWSPHKESDTIRHRPVSPSITSSTAGTAGRHTALAHRQLTGPSNPSSASHAHFRTHTPPSRSSSAQGRDLPKRQDSIGRTAVHAAQSLMERMGARASPTMRRAPLRGNSKEHSSDRSSDDDDDDDDRKNDPDGRKLSAASSGDEADKGHGRDQHPSRRSFGSFSQRRTTPAPIRTADASQRRGSARPAIASPLSASNDLYPRSASVLDGRKTPAKYRPDAQQKSYESGATLDSYRTPPSLLHHQVGSTPVAESPFTRTVPHKQASTRHSAIRMEGEAMEECASESPLFVPQARRGGLNLQSKGRKKRLQRAREARRTASVKRPLSETLNASVRNALWHMAHPIHTYRVLHASALTFIRDTDTAFRDPTTGQRCWRPEWLAAYVPLLVWLVISISSTVIVLIFHTQVFKALDELSRTLQRLGTGGRMVLGSLIFLTTFPPLPLYSTLIVLCGFSFGLWQGFLISYVAALSGAVVVFLLSKSFLKGWMTGLLAKSGGLKRVVRAIEKRPKLLFLIRLAPYPYNLMNTLLASSPTLTFKTYFVCTALALPKLLVHCGIGTSIKNFAAYHGATHGDKDGDADPSQSSKHGTAESIKKVVGVVGVILCVGIFLYLFSVARKAVDDELGEDEDDEPYCARQVAEGGLGSAQSNRRCGNTGNQYEALDMDVYSDDDDDDLLEGDADSDSEDHPYDTGTLNGAPGSARQAGVRLSDANQGQVWASAGNSRHDRSTTPSRLAAERSSTPHTVQSKGWVHFEPNAVSQRDKADSNSADAPLLLSVLDYEDAPARTGHDASSFRVASPDHDDSVDSGLLATEMSADDEGRHAHLNDRIARMEAEAERTCANPDSQARRSGHLTAPAHTQRSL